MAKHDWDSERPRSHAAVASGSGEWGPFGVIMSVYCLPRSLVALDSALRSAAMLRHVMRPPHPMALFIDAPGSQWLDRRRSAGLWDIVRPLSIDDDLRRAAQPYDPKNLSARGRYFYEDGIHASELARRNAFLYKLSSMLQSGFLRTLFVDNDVHVLAPTLVHDLLVGTLNFTDVAMPLDVGRSTGVFKRGPVPLLCTSLVAYRSASVAVRALLLGAAVRLVTRRYARINGRHIRQSDQEMVWLEWLESGRDLRVLPLPEEYYCPQVLPDADGRALWRSSRTQHPCKSVHSKLYRLTPADGVGVRLNVTLVPGGNSSLISGEQLYRAHVDRGRPGLAKRTVAAPGRQRPAPSRARRQAVATAAGAGTRRDRHVLTFNVPYGRSAKNKDGARQFANVTIPRLQRYARRVGASMRVIRSAAEIAAPPDLRAAWTAHGVGRGNSTIYVLKLLAAGMALERMPSNGRVLLIDDTVFVTPNATDVFEACPSDSAVCAFAEGTSPVPEMRATFTRARTWLSGRGVKAVNPAAYFNTGVVVFGASARPLLAAGRMAREMRLFGAG